MPRWVMSTDVDPPERTSRSGSCAATAARSVFFFSPVGSHAVFAVERRALAERREGDLRAAILEDVAPGLGLPEPEAARLALDGGERARLLVVGQRVRVDGVDAVRRRAGSTACRRWAAGGSCERTSAEASGSRSTTCARELRELAARDDRDLDALRERDQQVADARVDRALRRRERVVEVEGDEAGGRHLRAPASVQMRKAPPCGGASLLSG